MSGLDFKLPVFQVEIYHRNKGSDGLWLRAMNATDDQDVIEKATKLFESEGLKPVLIDRIEITPLTVSGGDESDRSGQVK